MKPGDLVVFVKNEGYSERIFLRDHLTWAEQRGRVTNGEVCIILEVEYHDYVVGTPDIKVLDQRGCVGWTLSSYFKKVSA